VDLGVQPLGYPSGVISSVMRHDRILQKALNDARLPLKLHPFQRGADMVGLLGERRLEAGLLGDMPTLLSASVGQVWIVGLVKWVFRSNVTGDSGNVTDSPAKVTGRIPAT
jgi:hypothetical protein